MRIITAVRKPMAMSFYFELNAKDILAVKKWYKNGNGVDFKRISIYNGTCE